MKRKHITIAVVAAVVVAGYLVVQATGAAGRPAVLGASNSPASRNAQRKAALADLKSAMTQYLAVHHKYPVVIPATQTEICASSVANCRTTKFLDMNYLVGAGYLPSVPSDPVGGTGHYTSGYEIFKDKSGVIHLVAVRAEDTSISLTF